MPNPTKVTRRVKAWAMINKGGGLEFAHMNETITRLNQELFAKKYPDIVGTVVPCTIIYQLPSKHKGKKKIR